MSVRVGAVIATLLIATLALPQIASAQEVALTGVVLRIDAGQGVFWLQEYGGQGRVWSVRMTNLGTPGIQPGAGIQVGDVVEVRGAVIGPGTLLARGATVRSRGGAPGIGTGPGIGAPPPGIARPGQRIEFEGVIVAMDRYRQGLLQVQDWRRSLPGAIWTVRLTGQTRIETRDRRRWDDDDDRWGDDGRGIQAAGRLLRVGDLVTVEGRVAGSQILAEEITVRGRGYAPPRSGPYPQPAPYPTAGWQTVILAPQAGSEVSGSEFTVVGRTLPGAQVQVHVQARWSVFQVQVANSTVTADQSGIFILAVRPTMRVPGATYTITATPHYQGVAMPPVTVTVRQI